MLISGALFFLEISETWNNCNGLIDENFQYWCAFVPEWTLFGAAMFFADVFPDKINIGVRIGGEGLNHAQRVVFFWHSVVCGALEGSSHLARASTMRAETTLLLECSRVTMFISDTFLTWLDKFWYAFDSRIPENLTFASLTRHLCTLQARRAQ